MKKRWILLVVLAIGLVTLSAFARSDRTRGRRRARVPSRPRIAECFEQAGIGEDVLDAMEAMRLAAIEALKEAESCEERYEIIEQLREDLASLFTEEQLAAVKECMRQPKPATCMDQIDLSPEQIELIDTIRAAALEAIKGAKEPQEAREIIEQMHQAIEDVLTEEQLEALRECMHPGKPVNCMDQIGLTEEQIAQLDAIRDAAIEAVKLAENRDEVRVIMDQMREDMMAVLTPDQVEALEACRDANGHRGNNKN